MNVELIIKKSCIVFFCIIRMINGYAKNSPPADHIDMQLNFQGDSLFVKATYTHYSLKADADSFYFLLSSEYRIASISAKGYISHKSVNKRNEPFPYTLIFLDKTSKKAASIDFKFAYVINLKETNFLTSDWVELGIDKLWYPSYNGLSNKFTSSIAISNLYNDFSVFSYPHATINYLPDGSIKIINDIAGPDVLMMAGKKMKEWKGTGSKIQTSFFARTTLQDSVLQSMNHKIENIIEFYNDAFAMLFPVKSLKILLRNTTKKEIGYQFYRPGMVTTGSDFNSYGNLAHEIGHHWWMGADYIREPWINEGFANYCMLLVLDKFDTAARNKIIADYTKASTGSGPVSGTNLFSENAYSIYYMKSAILLWNLDQLIGRKKMMIFLGRLIKEKKYSEQPMIRVLKKVGGNEAARTFSNWLKDQ